VQDLGYLVHAMGYDRFGVKHRCALVAHWWRIVGALWAHCGLWDHESRERLESSSPTAL